MKTFRDILTGLLLTTGLIVGLSFLHAQETGAPIQTRSASAFSFATNLLWLQIIGVTNDTAYLILNNTTDEVYEVWSKTDLTLTNWSIESEIWPTNPAMTPFTVPLQDRTNALFIWARDWTGIDENSNGVPDWWEYEHLGGLLPAITAQPACQIVVRRSNVTFNVDVSSYSTIPLGYQWYFNETNLLVGATSTTLTLTNVQLANTGNYWVVVANVAGSVTSSNAVLTVLVPPLIMTQPTCQTAVQGGNATFTVTATGTMPFGYQWYFNGQNLLAGATNASLVLTNASSTNAGNYLVVVSNQAGSVTSSNAVLTIIMKPTIAIGGERIGELSTNGDLTSWGGNQFGESGDYTYLDGTNQVHIVGFTNLIKAASGLNHSLAIDACGTLWVWGQNNQGQLGDGGYENTTNLPEQVPGMTNVVAIAAHGYNSYGDGLFGLSTAVKADGTVWMWGSGDGYGFGTSPVQISGISNVTAVAAGSVFGVALKTDGTVWAWGGNYFGQLGNGTKDDSDTAIQVAGLSNIVAICAGDNHSLALASNGVVWAWGYDLDGELGDGETKANSDVPVMVTGLTNIAAIAAGTSHSLALDNSGKLWAWGGDSMGQLGDGGYAISANLPIPIVELSNIVSVAAGSDASAALDGDGNVWQWGSSDTDGTNWTWGDENGYPALASSYVDFYNGQLPNLTILNGNNQTLHADLEFPQPLVFQVTDPSGVALSNAPVSVEVIAGDMELRTVSGGDNYKGLRLTTDANGEVSLIGHVGRTFSNPSCLVRVLAASREKIVEADFNETLVQPPTISITSPAASSTCLVGTNQTLAITVDAEAAPGASIQEVDYSCQTNGGGNIPLGISTDTPYSFIWTNSVWWSNAFVGQYTLSAAAVDDSGARSDPQSVNFTIALDTDGNGMPDYWQLQYFGHPGVAPNADPDGDGISNLQEYQNGTDPTDYYNGVLPNLVVLSANNQDGTFDSFLPLPVVIEVIGANSAILTNAPVVLAVTNGTALLAVTTNDTPVTSLALRTDTNGQVKAWIYFPPASSNSPDSTIVASAFSGTNSVTDIVNEFIPLAHWRFDNTNTWVGEEGQLPLLAANVVGIPDWSSNAVLVDNASQAVLAYNVAETNGDTNITCQTGSLMFWFKPDWSSANVGGNGPGGWGRLIEMGDNNPDLSTNSWTLDSTNGWWALYLSPDGTQLSFSTSTNGGGMTNLSANVAWFSNEWYQITLTYSPTDSALYVDGQLLANGAGVTYYPNTNELANGFRIGSDENGKNQAEGAFDELQTFDYPLSADEAATYDSQIPDWWEVEYFGRAGLDPEFQLAGDGFTLLLDYQRSRDPNAINFSLSATNQYVNTNTVPVQINVVSGEPAFMAIMIENPNRPDAKYQPYGTTLNFSNATWQPYSPNIIASLNSGDGGYNVRVAVKGLSPDAQTTWQPMPLILDTVPPVLVVTNPVANVVAEPMIQLQGYANESLGSLTYDISNATGIWTNLTGFVTGQFCDTNLQAITTNWFQCYDIVLATNGSNVIVLHATDLAGNPFTTNLGFTVDSSLDTNPPVFTLAWPQDGTVISGTNFILQGMVSDPMARVIISIADNDGNTNTVAGVVTRTGQALADNIPLGKGTNIVVVTTTDTAGSNVTHFSVIKNDLGLTLNPLMDNQLNQSFVTVSGSIGNPGDTVMVNGLTATVNGDGVWTVEDVPVSSSGQAILSAAVYDGGNNLIASQTFAQTQPVSVVLKSFWRQVSNYHVDLYWPNDGWSANPPYNASSPPFSNGADDVEWAHQSGGRDSGYFFNTGGSYAYNFIKDYFGIDQVWNDFLPAGDNLSLNGNAVSYFGDAQWKNTSDTMAKVMIEPMDPAVAGATAAYLVQAVAWKLNSIRGPGDALPSDSLQINGQILMPVTNTDGSIWGETVIQAPAGANIDVTPAASGNYYFNVQATELGMQMAVDNNRDGNITFDAADATSTDRPYRFWVNNDYDGYDPGIGDYADLDPARSSDANNLAISCTRDLEDYTRLWVNTQGITRELLDGTFLLALEWKDVTDDPKIQFFQAAEADGGARYLVDSDTAQQQYANYGTHLIEWAHRNVLTKDNPFIFPSNFWAKAGVTTGQPVAHLLFDAVSRGSGQLVISIYKNDGVTKLAESQPLCLKLQDVKEMYERWTVGDGNGGAPAITATPSLRLPPGITTPFQYNSSSPEENEYILFVHGWNLAPWERDAFAETAFKRLYWQGYKGRFGAFQWPTEYGFGSWKTIAILDPDNFDNSEFNAWSSGAGLLGLLNRLNSSYPGTCLSYGSQHGKCCGG